MNGRCNLIMMDEAALISILRDKAKEALQLEEQRLLNHMRREVDRITCGGAPGKSAWCQEIAQNLEHTATAVTDDSISIDFGYSPSGKADDVRAMVVEAGSSSAAGSDAIHAGPAGRSVWDDDLSKRHPSRAWSKYAQPETFNQTENGFVENAVRMMRAEFGDMTELVFTTTPDSAYYGNVTVKSS